MTTVLDIITHSYRETNLIPIGDVPSADQTSEALFLLQNLVSSVLGNEAGQPLRAVSVGTQNVTNPDTSLMYTASPCYSNVNVRFNLNLSLPLTITLPATPADGARFAALDTSGTVGTYNVTIKGNGRLIEGGQALILGTNGVNLEWFYRADLGNWVRVIPLVLTDLFPFPQEFNDFFITYMSMRLNPRSGAQAQAETSEMLKRAITQFRSRYYQKEEAYSELGLLMMPSRKYWLYNHNDEFTSGMISYNF